MRFLFPSLFLFWAPLVLVPIVLYLFRPRPKTVKTSTMPFFKWLDRAHQDSAWLRWLKYFLSLLLSILVVLGAAAALGRLVVSPRAEEIKTVVIMVDRSASMAAQDAQGRSRLQVALDAIGRRVTGLTAGVGVAVVAYDQRPEVLLARSVDRREVERALASIKVRPIEGNAKLAMNMARQLAVLETPAAIWHATDGPADDEGRDASDEKPVLDFEETSEAREATIHDAASDPEPAAERSSREAPQLLVEHMNFALAEPLNVGITAVEIRRLPLERATFEAFVQLQCSASEPVAVTLDVLLGGDEVDLRELKLEPGQRETLLVEIKADQDEDRVAQLRLTVEGDKLATDNVVYACIPRLRPIKVLWVSQAADPYTELALASIGVDNDLEVFQGSADAWPPKEDIDVVIFDDWLPDTWPDQISAIAINPPGSCGPVRAVRLEGDGLPISDLRAPLKGHPLLYGVATPRVEVNQTAVLAADGPLQPLWVGTQGPVLLAGQSQGQRIAVFGFSPQQSTALPYLASYPMLIGNAIYWAAEEQLEKARGLNRRTGSTLEIEGRQLTWVDPDQPEKAVRVVDIPRRSVELDQVGLWRTDAGALGSAALLSAQETQLHRGTSADVAERGDLHQAASFIRGDLAPWLLWSLVAILLLESWLYHRCITS